MVRTRVVVTNRYIFLAMGMWGTDESWKNGGMSILENQGTYLFESLCHCQSMGSFHPKIWKDDHQGRVDVSNLNDYNDSNNQEPLSTIVRTTWYFFICQFHKSLERKTCHGEWLSHWRRHLESEVRCLGRENKCFNHCWRFPFKLKDVVR